MNQLEMNFNKTDELKIKLEPVCFRTQEKPVSEDK